eukprot:COSAG05_NODE_28_length_29121_cov_56.951933_18_plen_97_part_00
MTAATMLCVYYSYDAKGLSAITLTMVAVHVVLAAGQERPHHTHVARTHWQTSVCPQLAQACASHAVSLPTYNLALTVASAVTAACFATGPVGVASE